MKKPSRNHSPRPETHAGLNLRYESFFHLCAHKVALAMGSPYAFVAALLLIAIWLVSGPVFHFSDTWQLLINTGTTIATFLMVFLIQNTQNRDTKAMHLKLDELLRGEKGARNTFINLEDLSEDELDHLQKEFDKICKTRPAKTSPPHEKTHRPPPAA